MSETLIATATVLVRMTAEEARECVSDIKAGIQNVGRRLLDLYERDGWLALGYDNWRMCAEEEFGYRQSHVYRLLSAASIEREISPIGENRIPESQLRPLSSLPPDAQREVWQRAQETAPGGKMTAAHVQRVVDEQRSGGIAHVGHNSGDNEWYTPIEYIDAAMTVMGSIDLDPASTEMANQVVGAEAFYTTQDDGLLQEWRGRVWMNPPYAQPLIQQFSDKLAIEVQSGNVTEALVLVNNATETRWFQGIAKYATAICFPLGRVRFWAPDKISAPLQGQAVLYIGLNTDGFRDNFEPFGMVFAR